MKTLDKELLINILANNVEDLVTVQSVINDIKDILNANAMSQALLRSKLETLEHDVSYLSLIVAALESRLQTKQPDS